jgi:hypothetical protein
MEFQLCHDFPKPDLEFCINAVRLGWSDVVRGLDYAVFSWKDVKDFADYRLKENNSKTFEYENEISFLGKNEASKIIELGRQASESEVSDEEVISKKWQYLLLQWLFINRHDIDNPFGYVESLWADFNYPLDMKNFIGFMPVEGEWNPMSHSEKENFERLTNNWEEFLKKLRGTLKEEVN